MGVKFNFSDAGLEELLFRVPEPAKVTIPANKINSPQSGKMGLNNTIILYGGDAESAVESQREEFLARFIKAINLESDETLKIDFNKVGSIRFQQLAAHYSFHYLIAFGVTPRQIGIHAQTVKTELLVIGSRKFIFTDPIEDLKQNEDERKRLWHHVQVMYGLKK